MRFYFTEIVLRLGLRPPRFVGGGVRFFLGNVVVLVGILERVVLGVIVDDRVGEQFDLDEIPNRTEGFLREPKSTELDDHLTPPALGECVDARGLKISVENFRRQDDVASENITRSARLIGAPDLRIGHLLTEPRLRVVHRGLDVFGVDVQNFINSGGRELQKETSATSATSTTVAWFNWTNFLRFSSVVALTKYVPSSDWVG